MNTLSNVKSFILLDWLNHSAEEYREMARRKFFFQLFCVVGIYTFLWCAVPHNTIWFRIACFSFLFVFPKYVGRFIVSWDGWFKNIRTGFFVCGSHCRRLKPARQISKEKVGGRIVCRDDGVALAKQILDHEKHAQSEQETDESIRELWRTRIACVARGFKPPPDALDAVEASLRERNKPR